MGTTAPVLLASAPVSAEPLLAFKSASAVCLLALFLSWESLRPFHEWHRGAPRDRAAHALRNFALGALNTLCVAALFAHLWQHTAAWTHANHFGLLHWLALPDWVRWPAAIVTLDLWTYWWHRFSHTVPLLWRFHRTHHSDAHMDATSATRFHVGEIACSAALRVPVLALLGAGFGELLVYETLLFAVTLFHHANIRLPAIAERLLAPLVVTPAIHRVHHSRLQPETDSNYASLLSVWDRLFRTARTRGRVEDIRYGLDGWDAAEHHTVTGLLRTPLREEEKTGSGAHERT